MTAVEGIGSDGEGGEDLQVSDNRWFDVLTIRLPGLDAFAGKDDQVNQQTTKDNKNSTPHFIQR